MKMIFTNWHGISSEKAMENQNVTKHCRIRRGLRERTGSSFGVLYVVMDARGKLGENQKSLKRP